MSVDKLTATLLKLVQFFDHKNIPYMIMGGYAVGLWAVPRATFDIDLTIQVAAERIPDLCSALERRGFTVPEEHVKGFLNSLQGMPKFRIQLNDIIPPLDIDIFLVATPYQEEAFSRRRQVSLLRRRIWLMSPKDLVLHKLIAARQKDVAAIEDILAVVQGLDVTYMRRWAGVLDIRGRLEDCLRRAGIVTRR